MFRGPIKVAQECRLYNSISLNEPDGELHWHIEIYPKTDRNNEGIELASGINSNDVSPEKAAEILSLATRKQIAELLGVS